MDADTLMASTARETKDGLPDLENKTARPEGGPVRPALDELAAAFAAFKETNDARLGALEGRRGADVLTEEKLARIDAALDAARTRLDRTVSNRPGRRSASRGRARRPARGSTRRPSTSTSGPARAPGSSAWRPRPFRRGRGRMAAISCRTRSSAAC
jgi:hypothetical protein